MLHVISCVALCGTYNFIHKFLCGSAVNDPIGFDKCFRCMISPGIDTSQIVTRCLFPKWILNIPVGDNRIQDIIERMRKF